MDFRASCHIILSHWTVSDTKFEKLRLSNEKEGCCTFKTEMFSANDENIIYVINSYYVFTVYKV
jgi:hypothetical protein